ncbi:ABC transporter ATP-binding protein [Streptomyces albipurpureus]|uniref:ABC transporter ATP-binding protein/permease n=1 Tax=Streptomyces albipurpureus TaxID=2897419 RepID=A0ABT0UH57_9ACTN|nr:ABC transporter ATP-binding protein [Streptomyces sp. CWNU-1]MCM2387957.1 ABC transporter ATP-binding protein/permease [Streptomyces sp. CWNU-1]
MSKAVPEGHTASKTGAPPAPFALGDLPDQRAVFRRAAPFLSGHRTALAAAIALTLAGAGLAVAVTAAIGRLVDAAGDGERAGLIRWVVVLFALVAASGVLTWLSRYWLIRVGEHVLAGMRERATAAVGAAPLRFVESHRRGELLRRLTGEINGLGYFVGTTLPDLVAAVAVLAFTVVMLAVYSWLLILGLLVVFVPVATVIVRGFHRRAGPAYAEVAAAEAAVAASFSESLPAQEQLRISGAVPRWLERFGRNNDRLLDAQTVQIRTELRLDRLALLQAGCVGGLLVLSAVLVGRNALTVGTAVVFVLATRDIFHRFESVAAAIGDAREAHVQLARLLDLIRATEQPQPATDSPQPPARGVLTLAGVGFGYSQGQPVVQGLSLAIESGERLVIAGETGSGKSTLGKLLAGLYHPDQGTVSFAGHDLSCLSAERLRARIVLVPQEVALVEGSLAENLALVSSRPDQPRIEETIERLGLSEWVASLPDGLATPVGTHTLSAGECQLVAIARAVLADPAVLILDEATAGVDHQTAGRIEEALSVAADDRTLIVIAHRADTIGRGRLLLSMPEGRVTEIVGPRS